MKTEQDAAQGAKTGTMLDETLLVWLKGQGATKASKVVGPNGAFISYTTKDGRKTLPVGRNSQDGKLEDYGLILTDDSQLIATVNNYVEEESIEL